MPAWLPYAISGGVGLLGNLLGGGKPNYGMSRSQIDALINAFREKGMAGLRTLGERAQGGAVSRMASQGYEMTPSMQSALFTPIVEQLAGARAGLEGNLAGVQGGMLQHRADQQFGADMMGYQNQMGLFNNLMDIGGMGLLGQSFMGQGGGGGGGYQGDPEVLEALQKLFPQG